ncbi:MAG TPA: hypothetical protein VK358_03955, partial [Longimicrobium sp.]|nr:hypothetical protein [Longimicrobium sp.]
CKWHSEAEWLRRRGVPAERVLDTSRVPGDADPQVLSEELAVLEAAGAPRMRDVVMMDRHLRREEWEFALRYLGTVNREVTRFLEERGIELVSTLPDTALQILSLWIARGLGIPAVVPTPLRYPLARFGFCPSHEPASFVPIRPVEAGDREEARRVVDEFRAGRVAVVTGSPLGALGAVVAALPRQVAFFRQMVRWARHDGGQRHHRWTLGDIGAMYVRKRFNLVRMRAGLRYQTRQGPRPFVLYAVHVQPESSIDVYGAFFANQLELVTHIARSTPATHDLYVKIHLGDMGEQALGFYRALQRIPGVVLIGPEVPARALVERAAVVFTVSGTMAMEAGMLGRPAVTFGRMFFNALPTVHYCPSPPQLPALVSRLLAEGPARDPLPEIVEAMAAMLASSFAGQFTRRGAVGLPEPQDGTRMAAAYHALLATGRGAARGAGVSAPAA